MVHTGKMPAGQPKTGVNRPLQLLASSQLTPNKGHAELLDSLAAMRAKGHAFHCHILGEGTAAEALREQAARLGLEDSLSWHGLQANVYSFLQRADVFVLPSYEEGLPNTLLEAMSQGLAPVSRDVGGVKEIWPDGLDGLLFGHRPGDLTAALETVFKADDAQLLAWSGIALDQCRAAFNQAVQARRLYDWYAALAAGNFYS